MPRTSRNTVEFFADGLEWVATFSHLHNEDGLSSEEPLRVKHVTTCHLSYKGHPPFISGKSLCSMKDRYQWRYGVKESFRRALENTYIDPSPPTRRVYGECMQAFFRELRFKNYPPHLPSIIDGEVVSSVDGLGRLMLAPPEHGLGHVGAE